MIWLVGNKGMLGTAVEDLLKKTGTPYLSSDREVDITDAETIEDFFVERLKEKEAAARRQAPERRPAEHRPSEHRSAGLRPAEFNETGRPGGYRKPGSIAPEETGMIDGARDAGSETAPNPVYIINCAAYTA